MRRFLRHTFVWLLALSFVASGAAWRQCVAAQPAAGATVMHRTHDAKSHHDHAMQHSHLHGDYTLHQQAADNPPPNITDDHACSKCCGICTVAGMMPTAVDAAIFAASFITFSRTADDGVGTTVGIDPGIPKRIA